MKMIISVSDYTFQLLILWLIKNNLQTYYNLDPYLHSD